MINTSETITHVLAAMLKVQGDVDGVAKDRQNPHLKNRYASLESVIDAIREPCQRAGLVVMQAPGEFSEGTLALTTMIAHAESGEWIRSTVSIPVQKPDPQGAGSALTYAERYSLMALFCLPAVDDDAETAARPQQRPAQAERAAPPPTQRHEDIRAPQAPKVGAGGIPGLRSFDEILNSIAKATSISGLEKLMSRPEWQASFANLDEDAQTEVTEAKKRRVANIQKGLADQMARTG